MNKLPSFKNPPVVETAISVQFRPIEGFTNAHLGLFWSRMRSEYPCVMDAEPIRSQIELFGDQLPRRPRLPTFRVVTGEAAVRLQMTTEDGRSMVQLQNGRLVHNWRRLSDGTYPRWKAVLPKFEDALAQFLTFLDDEGLQGIEHNQWEVTYVNQFIRGREWGDPRDWPRLLPGLVGAGVAPTIASTEYVECKWRFVLADHRGRLHVDLFHGFESAERDAQEMLVMQLTARGAVDKTRGWDLPSGLANGRAAIVRTFDDLTGPDAHLLWGKEQ